MIRLLQPLSQHWMTAVIAILQKNQNLCNKDKSGQEGELLKAGTSWSELIFLLWLSMLSLICALSSEEQLGFCLFQVEADHQNSMYIQSPSEKKLFFYCNC